MAEILKLKVGSTVPVPEKLHEGFEVRNERIKANIGIDKIEKIMQDFVEMQGDSLYFFLSLPRRIPHPNGSKIGLSPIESDYYYLDDCHKGMASAILTGFGQLLTNDGVSTFGFGNSVTHDEFSFGRFNVAEIFSINNIEKYAAFLEERGFERTERLTTAWTAFPEEALGGCAVCEIRGKTIFDIPKVFAKFGMYRDED